MNFTDASLDKIINNNDYESSILKVFKPSMCLFRTPNKILVGLPFISAEELEEFTY